MKRENNEKFQALNRTKMSNKKCPLADKLFSECHCSSMSSLSVQESVYYCSNNYEKCGIYENLGDINKISEKKQYESKVLKG